MERRQRRHRNRQASRTNIFIGELDKRIFRLLARYRYLTPAIISGLLGYSEKQYITRRLRELLDHHYLTQYNARDLPLSFPDFYIIDELAIEVLKGEGMEDWEIISLYRKEQNIPAPNFDHDFAACNVIASLEIEAPKFGYEFITWQDILQRCGPDTPLSIPYKISYRFPNGSKQWDEGEAEPDGPGLFGLKSPKGKFSYFALELETGNNPIEPSRNLKRPSTLKKGLVYADALKKAVHKTQFKISNLRTLFVTKSPTRVSTMQSTLEKVIGPTNQFSLTHYDLSKPSPCPFLFDREWQRVGLMPATIVPIKK